MLSRVRGAAGELGRMVMALAESWPAMILAAIFIVAALVFDTGGQ